MTDSDSSEVDQAPGEPGQSGEPGGEAGFDAFYRATRERVLVSTYALTGDRAAATTAVREAYVSAWQHRRHRGHRGRSGRTGRPGRSGTGAWSEAGVRESAWTSAYRRHGARLWHRDQDADAQVRATLDALATLTGPQRRVLLLTHLAHSSLEDTAAEVGLTRAEAEQQLALATTRFTSARDLPEASALTALEPLDAVVEDVAWPGATTLRRTGGTRRRTRTAVGALVTAAVLVGSGLFVADPSGLQPTLAQALDGDPPGTADASAGTAGTAEGDLVPEEAPELLPRSTLLGTGALDRLGGLDRGQEWRATSTGDNSEGNGLVLPCQQERYLDPEGEAALVREFRAGPSRSPGLRPRAVQLTEVSSTAADARRAFRSLVGWVGSCTEPRTQLLATRSVDQVGDQSRQLVLRSWGSRDTPVSTSVIQVSRTGLVTTATSTTYAGRAAPDVRSLARLQARAVSGVCGADGVEGAGACAGRPRLSVIDPPPTGEVPALISEIDLPPVSGVDQPWVGTEPQRARTNAASTGCDDATFAGRFEGARWRQNLTRTFLVPEADLPTEFGLTESLGILPAARAGAFVEQVRTDLASCADRDLGTRVEEVTSLDRGGASLTVWQLTTEVSDQRSIRFSMAVLRRGTAVAQLGFVPAPGVSLREGAFVELAERALARLDRLPQRGGG